MGFLSLIRRKTSNKAIFCGLDSSGKSTIISFLQEGRFVEHTPTMGKQKQEIEVQGTRISLFDLGGQASFRKMWLGELKNAKCVVFVIDKADPSRFEEAKTELQNLIPMIKQNQVKLLIFANKNDLKNAVSISTIIDTFDLTSLDNFEIIEISAKTGFGMADAFVKFYSALTGKQLKKNAVAAAISIYSQGGVPYITQAKNDEEFNQDVLEGGFLAAITNFANMKMDNTSVKFESKQDGTYIILKTENFIGALLWKSDLQIPIDASESALKDLLCHLEETCNCKDPEDVAFHVTQYCTNMM